MHTKAIRWFQRNVSVLKKVRSNTVNTVRETTS